MNNFKSLTLITTLFVSGLMYAQNVEVINGKPFQVDNTNENIVNVLNPSKENFSFLTKRRKKYKLITLDKNLGLESSKPIVLPEVKGKEVKYITAAKLGDKTYFFSKSWDKKANTFTLYASELNLKTAKFDKHIEVLKATDDKFNFLSNPFTITRNIDSTKILYTIQYPTKGKEKAKFGFAVTDNSMNELWKNDIIFDELDKNFTADQFLIDKNGNVHITATVRMDRDEKKDKGAASRFYKAIYSYFYEKKDLVQYEVGFKDEIILSAMFKLNEKSELVCTGFYGEKKFFDAGMKGFFYLRIDPTTKQVVAKNLSPFDTKFLSQLMSERRAKKGKSLNGYVVRETFNLSDGGMAVVSEYYVYTYYQDDKGRVTQTWSYGNVLVFFLDKEGKMNTYSILKKNQYAVSNSSSASNGFIGINMNFGLIQPSAKEVPYYGIGCMMKDDKLQLIYNENPKNEARAKAGKRLRSVRQRTSVTNLVQFDRDGKITSTTLFKSKDNKEGYKMPVMPEYHYNYSKDGMIVIGKKGRNVRMVNLEIK
jgi:hypothetical protein